uniref:C2H2-type domain-containing protein n=1 Tax=Periophthalmus magnuspinnatus TaxID=409849 RepID=A0A3B4ALM9_9GOBI
SHFMLSLYESVPLMKICPGILGQCAEKHKRFICSFQGCFAAYNKQWKLDAHLCKHTGVKPHTCGYQGCGKSFCSPYHLARHELIHSGDKPFPCTEEGCSEAFTTNSNRLRHIDRFHRDTQEPRLYVCKFEDCGLRFKKNKQLKSHMCEQHEKLPPYQCTFEERNILKAQLLTLFFSFFFTSTGKSFCSPYHLARHELIHSGDKPFPCTEEGCSEAFTTNSNRLRHIDRFHRDTQEPRLYVCKFEDCGLRFKKNKQLKSHMFIHDPERKKIRKAPNKRSLASRLSGFEDKKTSAKTSLNPVQNRPGPSPDLDPGLNPDPRVKSPSLPNPVPNPGLNPSPVQNPHPVQTLVQFQELIFDPNNGLNPSGQSLVQDHSPNLVQDSVELVSLLQDTSLLCETHVSNALSASVTA